MPMITGDLSPSLSDCKLHALPSVINYQAGKNKEKEGVR